MRKTGLITAALASIAFLASAGEAQAQFSLGPRVAFGTDHDLAVGGAATLAFDKQLFPGTGPLTAMLAFDYYVDCTNCTYFEIAPTVFVPAGDFHVGAGLIYARISADVPDNVFVNIDASASDIGLAIHGGYTFELGSQRGMADARFGLGASEQLVLSFTYLFNFGGGGND